MMHKLALAAALSQSFAGLGAAQTTLEPEAARLTAAQLLARGHAQAAADITDVLVLRDPKDSTSLILNAHARRTLGDNTRARQAARQGWQTAERPVERYGAAMAMAQALSSDGAKTRAQFWLRRAAHVAPDAPKRARAIRDYRYVSTTNPWSVNLSFSINPSDNVNEAPSDNTFVLGGLIFTNPAAIPISGVVLRQNTALRYNFGTTQTERNFVSLNWTESHTVFTDDDVPAGLNASDFAFRRVQAQIGRDFTTGPEAPRQTLSLSFGRLWSANDPLADEVKVDWRQTYVRPEQRLFSWNAELGYSHRKDSNLRSGVTASLGSYWARPIASGGRLSWNATLGRTDTDSRALTHTALTLGMQYTFAKPVLGATAQVALSAQAKQYDDPLYGPDPRADLGAVVSTSLVFTDFDTYGFAPKLTLEARKTNSNVTRFETENFGLNMGFQSLF